MKRILLLAALLPMMLAGRAANLYGIPEGIQEGNMLHCFDWTHADVIAELPTIAAAGFGAIQISPMERPIRAGVIWYDVYRPYDHKLIDNDMGTRETLKQLCDEAAKYGIKIIVDMVGNHIDANGPHDEWWNSNDRQRTNPPGCNYSNRESITQGQMGNYGDVNTENPEVQQRARAYMDDLKSLGVAGIRWDAAKHIALPSEGSEYWRVVTEDSGLYHYGEILGTPGGSNANALMKEYTTMMSVTDDRFSEQMLSGVRSGNLPASFGRWLSTVEDATKIVYWGESHDTYANADGSTKGIEQNDIDRAWALLSARRGETSLYFSRPPFTGVSDIKIGQKGSTHFADAEIAAVNHLRNAAVGTADSYVRATNGSAAMVARQGIGAVIVCAIGKEGNVTLTNPEAYIPAGTYYDEVTGNAFTVTATEVIGTVGDKGIAVIYKSDNAVPVLTLNPGNGTTFRTESLEVSARIANATEGWVQVDGGEKHTFTDTYTFTIGAETEIGSQITVTWGVTNGTLDITGTAVYTKRAVIDPVYVWYNNPHAWGEPHIHYYGSAGGTAWPGPAMSYDTEKGLWYYLMPDDFADLCQIIVNNNGGGQQYPASTGLYVEAHTMLLVGETWGKSELVPSEAAAAEGNYIWYANENGYEDPCVWAWGGSSANLTGAAGWPGDHMVYVADKGLWRWDVPGELPTTLIISNNGDDATKSADLAFVNHGVYHADNTVTAEERAAATVAAYLRNTDGWNNPVISAWDCEFVAAEATPLVFDSQYGLWRWDLPADKTYPVNVTFGNGTATLAEVPFHTAWVYDLAADGTLYAEPLADCLVIYLDTTSNGWSKPRVIYAGGTLEAAFPGEPMGWHADKTWVYTLPVGTATVQFTDGTSHISAALAAEHLKTYAPALDEMQELGIDSVDAATQTTLWYDLQGRRVANPGRGIYLRRQGSTVTKVIR